MSLFTNSHIVPCWREIRRGASFFHPERIISFDYGMAGTDRPVGSADFLVVVLVGIYSFTSASACKLPFHPHIHKHSTQLNQTNNFSSLLHNNSPPTQPNSSFTKKNQNGTTSPPHALPTPRLQHNLPRTRYGEDSRATPLRAPARGTESGEGGLGTPGEAFWGCCCFVSTYLSSFLFH